jgi:hypothetical protein
MSDIVYQGVVNKTGAPPFDTTPPPRPERDDAVDVVQKHIDGAITGGSEEERVRLSVKELNHQREARGELGEIPEPTPRFYDDKKPRKLREVSTDISNRHYEELPEAQFASQQLGLTPAEVRELGKNPDWVQQMRPDWTRGEAEHYCRTGESPPSKVLTVDDREGLRPPLRDHDRIKADQALSLKDAAREVGNFRRADAAANQQLLADLQQREVQQQEAAESIAQEAKRAEEAKAAEQRRAQEAQQAEAARAQLAQREAQLDWERQASAEEKQLVDAYQTWEQWAQKIPELMSFEALERTRHADPVRYNEIMKHAQRGKQFQAKLIARSKELYELRQGRALLGAVQQHEQATAARSRYNETQDARFEEMVKKDELVKSIPREALRKAVRDHLHDMGWTDKQIAHEYNHGSLRDAGTQMTLSHAGALRLIKESRIATASRRASIPPVQAPGVSRPRGAGDIENVRALERQLASAKGNKSLQIARRLTQARRAAGLV